MTLSASSVAQEVGNWIKIFPRNVTENYKSSVTFMKQLTIIALSNITYYKGVFPDDSYKVETFSGVEMRILKEKCQDEMAQFLQTAITNSFEAFNKKYLHQLALCFYEDELKIDNLLEYYVFEYNYKGQAGGMEVHSNNRANVKQHIMRCTFNNVKDHTLQMIHALNFIMQKQDRAMPKNYITCIRLYYNEDAPKGYQAPGFHSTDEAEDHLESLLSKAESVGCVETPYHKIIAKSCVQESPVASNVIPSGSLPIISQLEDTGTDLQQTTSSEPQLRCPCNKYYGINVNKVLLLITCKYCNTIQHAACFGLLTVDQSRIDEHCCTDCSDSDPTRKPTDPKLAALSERKRECLSIFRRTLVICSEVPVVGGSRLVERLGVTEANAKNLMLLLDSYGIIVNFYKDRPLATRKINVDQLKVTIKRMFVQTEDTTVDRLLATTVEQSNPVENLMQPTEKKSLRNDYSLGRVINSSAVCAEDANIKEYRDALVFTATEEELPLSGSHNPVKDVEKVGKKTDLKRNSGAIREKDDQRLTTRATARAKRTKLAK